MNGALIIDKPQGITSHDVVNRVRWILGERSVGHIGTLDPMATGVLPLLIGRFTRLAQFYLHTEKSYEGEIRLGFATDTYDAEGERVGEEVSVEVNLEQVRQAADRFRGTIEQMPPPFSAKKLGGVPAYKLARKKKPVQLKPVQVEVKEFVVEDVAGDRVRFRSRVASGTYLRSIAHELGSALGAGGHLASLRRTEVAEFRLAEAVSLEALADMQCPITDITLNTLTAPPFLHPRRLLPQIPAVTAPPEALPKLMHGNAVNLPQFSPSPLVKVFRGQDELIAIVKRVAGTLFQPKVVLTDFS